MRAEDLLESLRAELAPVEEAIRSHRFLDSLATGAVTRERLRAIAGEQQRIVASDRRSFAQLAARFPSPPAGDWFLSMALGEGEALALLDGYAAWLAIDEDWLREYAPDPRAQSYPAFVAWLALNGSVGAVTLAFLANLAAWGENCGRVAAALRDAYNAGDDAVAFFEFFAAPPPGFRENTLAVVQAGLDAGDDPREMRDAARLLQGYELLFWDGLADEL
jgi:thiaminase